ncbi:MAG: glutamate--tRNA ligase [Candidatus Komeilibacteria bacterium]
MFNFFKRKVVTRFAPSPTGWLHIGGLRTAFYSYLFAKQNKGKFILRLEDTDRNRLVAGAANDLVKTLDDFGIIADEGLVWSGDKIISRGKHAPYKQSERLDIYHKYIDQLLDSGQAYRCFCSSERLEKLREKQVAAKQPPGYDGYCRDLPNNRIKQYLQLKKPYVIRFRTPHNQNISFHDEVRGDIVINSQQIDDQIILKSDGYPTYHLAVVVDDHEMGVTHVIRGEEWLPSTPKHILLYQALGWPLPTFVHLPLLLNKDRSKLSKRTGDVAAQDYLQKGYLPSALLNFIVLLGWNPGTDQEIFSYQQLLDHFSLAQINKAGAVFDLDKLNWFNQQYIQSLSIKDWQKEVKKWLSKYKPEWQATFSLAMAEISQTRLEYIAQLPEIFHHWFDDELKYDSDLLIFKKSNRQSSLQGLLAVKNKLESSADINWQPEHLQIILNEVVNENKLTNGDVFWPLRVALSGLNKSESPIDLLFVLGKEKALFRLSNAINLLKKT